MTPYTAESLEPFLRDVRGSNLAPRSRAVAQRLAADAVALTAKVQALEAQLATLQERRINQTVNQPSGKKPEWNKGTGTDSEKKRRKRKPGGRRAGSGNRPKTRTPTESVHNTLDRCSRCDTDLGRQPVLDTNTRIVEDIAPPPDTTVVTAETSDRKWCPTCQRIVSARSELALPRSDIGLHATVLMAYLWVVPALSLPNIQAYLARFFRLDLSTSGISRLLIRTANILTPVADEILDDVRSGFQIWADETGWRVRGVTWWLWAFANQSSAYYHATPNRGSPVVVRILGSVFAGVLITDAWAAYNILDCLGRQTCMAHLFRKIRFLIQEHPQARSLLRFYTRLKRLLRDGEHLQHMRDDIGEEAFLRRYDRLEARLDDLLAWKNPNPLLAKFIASLQRQRDRILTFVLVPDCPNHNNFGEYIIRKGVLKRKVSGGSMAPSGAQAYATLISIAQTCQLRQIHFASFLRASLTHYCRTGRPLLLSEYASRVQDIKSAA
jgi:transposase